MTFAAVVFANIVRVVGIIGLNGGNEAEPQNPLKVMIYERKLQLTFLTLPS